MGSLVTRIHGRYYDVGAFDHPGGCPALECARDRDATALFESYHALHRARPLHTLKQYEIPAEQAQSPGRFLAEDRFGGDGFDWDETLASPFRRDLIECVTRYLQQERARRRLPSLRAAAKAPPRRWLEIVLIGAAFFAVLVPFVRGSWLAMLAVPFLGWLLVANFWHDALHFGLSRHWRVNQLLPYIFPWFLSPTMWMHQHVIGHHVFTNDPQRDPDVRAAPRQLRQSPWFAWRPAHRRQKRTLRVMVLYSLITLTRNGVRDHLFHYSGWVNGAVPLVIGTRRRRLLHVAGRLLVAASLFVWPFFLFPFWKAVAFATIPSLVLSELFALFSQVNHVTAPNIAAAQAPSSNWYEAQVRTSCSYATGSYLAFLLSGGLNLQIEHHLLPGVNHAHLFRLSPAIQEICAKHGVPYHSYPTFRAALRAHFAALRQLGEEPAATEASAAAIM